jgi:TolB-like protein
MSFLRELRRRNVFKVGTAYLVMSWLLIQVVDIVLPTFNSPEWIARTIVLLLILGFPVAVVLAWAYEITPQGIKRDRDVPLEKSVDGSTGQKLNYAIIAALAAALVIVILDNYVRTDSDPLEGLVDVSHPVPGFSNRAAIAVLPFVNLSADPAQDYFSDGITEDIITGLQSFGGFPIISRTSTFSFKGNAPDVREIAKTLGAGYVLEGSVRKVENRVRINAQLIDANGRHIWAELYDRDLHDIFAVQDEIKLQIIGAIEPELLTAEMDQAALVRTEDMEAWDYYLQSSALAPAFGGYADRQGRLVSIESMEQAMELAQKAVELDSAFADAYTLLGHVSTTYARSLRGQVGDDIADEALQDGFEYTRRGRELSPFSATTCSCYVWFLSGGGAAEYLDLDAALEIQEDAVRLNPANAIARAVLGFVYLVHGRYDEALLEAQVAKRLSPRDVALSYFFYVEAAAELGLGNWESAVDLARSAIRLTPLNFDGHAVRIAALYALGDAAAAASAAELLEESIPDFTVQMITDGPMPASLVPSVSPLLNMHEKPRYRQVVAAILEDLE